MARNNKQDTTMQDILSAMQAGFDGVNARLDAEAEARKALAARIEALEEKESETQKPTNPGRGAGTGKVKDVPFTKHDGTVVYGTRAQVDAWTKRQQGYKSPEERAAELADKKATYEPSEELIAHLVALKDAGKCFPTCKEVKNQFGFVGTKKDYEALRVAIRSGEIK